MAIGKADLVERMSGFIRNEDGAVTVDWVVLTACVVALGFAVMTIINEAVYANALTGIADVVVAAGER